MKDTKDINGREVKVFDTIIYPGKDRRGPTVLRKATVTGIVAKKSGWRQPPTKEVVLKVTYKKAGSSWETHAQVSKTTFMVLPSVEEVLPKKDGII